MGGFFVVMPRVVGMADHPMKLKPALTRYVLPGWYIYTSTGTQADAGRIYYIPIFVPETTAYTAIGIYVVTGAAGVADLRVFGWSNGVPGPLVLSAGTVDTSTGGAKETPISLTLSRGYYFLAVRCTGTPVLLGPDPSYPTVPPVPGFNENLDGTSPLVVLAADAEYSDPAPAPTLGRGPEYAFVFLKEA